MVVVVVVVVVRTCILYDVSVHAIQQYAPNSGGRTPGSKLPASPPPLLRPSGGGQPWLKAATSQLTSQHEHRTSTTVNELQKVIDNTAPVVAQKGHAQQGHQGHAQQGHRQNQPCTCHCQAHNCLSGHTGHDAELHGPANEEESTARGAKPACTATAKCITVLLSIPAMMQRIRACERPQNTA